MDNSTLKPNRSQRYRKLLAEWTAFYNEPTEKLVNEFRRQGKADLWIADIVGITAQTLGQMFPRKDKK